MRAPKQTEQIAKPSKKYHHKDSESDESEAKTAFLQIVALMANSSAKRGTTRWVTISPLC